MNSGRSILIFLTLIGSASGQSRPALTVPSAANVRIPVLGYVASPSQANIRSMLGAPGAVVVGDPIALPDGVTLATVVPGQAFAIVERNQTPQLSMASLSIASAGDLLPIIGTFAHADRIVFSPSGTVAAIYSAALAQAQVITGLPLSPQMARQVDLSTLGSVPLTSLAVSDDGQSLLIGVSDGTSGAVWLFPAQGAARQQLSAGVPSAARFFAGRQDAVVADSGWQQVALLSSVGDQVSSRVLGGSAQGFIAPADVEISADQKRVWVADVNSLLAIDLGSGAVSAQSCPFTPSSFLRLTGRSVYLVSSQDGSATGMWAPDSAVPRVWQVTGK